MVDCVKVRDWLLLGLIVAIVPLSACSEHDSHATHAEHPAQVEAIDGSELSRVTLTEKAIERIALETTAVRDERLGGTQHKVVPYSSLIYDPQGRTWVYTSPKARTFVRAQVDVYRIEGDRVFLRDGPPVGTVVASVGVAELYGSESGVGH
jgi:hypothetical protein